MCKGLGCKRTLDFPGYFVLTLQYPTEQTDDRTDRFMQCVMLP